LINGILTIFSVIATFFADFGNCRSSRSNDKGRKKASIQSEEVFEEEEVLEEEEEVSEVEEVSEEDEVSEEEENGGGKIYVLIIYYLLFNPTALRNLSLLYGNVRGG
jgi:hypothetical protein